MSLAFFPGQGSQQVGMGGELISEFQEAKHAFEEASEAIKVDLKKLCTEGPESDLGMTANTQPCLLVNSVAAYRVLESKTGFKPTAGAGHSLGEYSALVCAGAAPLAQATRWVRARGQAMQEAVPAGLGSMAALLGLEDELVEELCKAATENVDGDYVVSPANFNAPGQVVIAGHTQAIEQVQKELESDKFKGGKFRPLNVSAPFHCALMEPARNQMAEVFQKDAPENLQLAHPYYPNRTARKTQEAGVVLDLLIEQIDHPVLWRQTVVQMMNDGLDHAIEFGPGKVLQGLAKRISRQEKKSFEVMPLYDLETLKAVESKIGT